MKVLIQPYDKDTKLAMVNDRIWAEGRPPGTQRIRKLMAGELPMMPEEYASFVEVRVTTTHRPGVRRRGFQFVMGAPARVVEAAGRYLDAAALPALILEVDV